MDPKRFHCHILENMEPDTVYQFLNYLTTKDLQKGIESLYGSGHDGQQIFDLMTRANSIKQEKDN